MARKICTILLALAIGFFGVLSISEASQPMDLIPESLNNISYTAMVKDEIYFVKDLIIADSFAEMDDGSVLYFLTIFTDGSGNDVAITMPMNKSNPLWKQANDYLNDPDQFIGDLTVNCYVKVESNYASDEALYAFFNEYVTDLRTSGYMVRSDSSLRLSYVCGQYDDPAADAKSTANVGIVVGIACIGTALLLIVLALKRSTPKAPKAPRASVQQPVYQAPAAPQGAAGDDVMAQLKQYQNLRDAGFLNDEEYERKRRELLGL